jgi:hypothetical protein
MSIAPMINPPLCENCGETAPTVFTTYRAREHHLKIALCEICARDEDIREDILERRLTALGPASEPATQRKKTVYVVVEVRERDDYHAYQPEKQPIAVFLTESRAVEFVISKRSEEYLHLDWEIVATGLEDYDL